MNMIGFIVQVIQVPRICSVMPIREEDEDEHIVSSNLPMSAGTHPSASAVTTGGQPNARRGSFAFGISTADGASGSESGPNLDAFALPIHRIENDGNHEWEEVVGDRASLARIRPQAALAGGSLPAANHGSGLGGGGGDVDVGSMSLFVQHSLQGVGSQLSRGQSSALQSASLGGGGGSHRPPAAPGGEALSQAAAQKGQGSRQLSQGGGDEGLTEGHPWRSTAPDGGGAHAAAGLLLKSSGSFSSMNPRQRSHISTQSSGGMLLHLGSDNVPRGDDDSGGGSHLKSSGGVGVPSASSLGGGGSGGGGGGDGSPLFSAASGLRNSSGTVAGIPGSSGAVSKYRLSHQSRGGSQDTSNDSLPAMSTMISGGAGPGGGGRGQVGSRSGLPAGSAEGGSLRCEGGSTDGLRVAVTCCNQPARCEGSDSDMEGAQTPRQKQFASPAQHA